MTEQRIQAIYQELQGYLIEAAPPGYWVPWQDGRAYHAPVNEAIKELIDLTGESVFYRFEIKQNRAGQFDATSFRASLSALIGRIHGMYFPRTERPFSGGTEGPSTIIQQTQTQSQSAFISLVLDFQEVINTNLSDENLDDNEKGFLQNVKDGIRNVTTLAQLLHLLLTAAQQFGMDLARLLELIT